MTFAYSNAQTDNTLLGARYIKLANTYLNADNINGTMEFLKKADKALEKQSGWSAEYWRAAADEAYGFAFVKMKMPDEARKHFATALGKYKRLITMENGSPDAIKEIMTQIEALENGTSGLMSSSNSGAIAGLSNSNVINYDNLKLRDLPTDIPRNAINISLANNKFRDFPSGLAQYSSLKYINLSNNRIRDFSPNYAEFKNVIWINLSDNRIKTIPNGISAMKNLEFLDLSNNRLKEIPADISNMKSLKVLNLMGNRIPFPRIKNLLQSMPNTNILHDEYINIEDEEPAEE